ncbi:HigA family addiction module antitoxin [Thiotrichales bacterium 19S9-12]|nr:HigA family addiction module antitoxin [Thiotrichales bacterium 19S9-11]MCF6811328.1 HigA family addiction module antitoxin [Thiotrichales bacterium 19S9-12]
MNKQQIVHPGEVLKELVIEAHPELTISKAAEYLKITRVALSRVLNAKSALTPDLAAKVEKVFGIKASLLLKIQASYDSYHAVKAIKKLKLKPYHYKKVSA